jgi:hypothetical protein
MSENLEREELHQVVDRAVEELLAEAGVNEPPVDAIALARHLGVAVSFDGKQTQRRGQRANVKQGAHSQLTEEQRQWLAAHEIGAHLQADLLSRLDIDPTQPRTLTGSLPNLLADHLLVPRRWLAEEGRAAGYDLLDLKQRFRTASQEIIAWRLLDLPEPCIITIIDNDHVHRRRSNAWRINRELSEPEKRCQRYVHQYNRPHTLAEEGWTVQGWPVHQVDWKREVLRSVIEDQDSRLP